ncbi:sugar phosphate isomerase/epimerase family protein [Limosilactobacillus caecicola]|uniref:sugar phosphate isomerase/epimerase family protein n=1 Tax=Limosilactobacillus caecicola TaxID=2941332 RepID=UPI00203E4BD7|nr:TIM barrel protein [Limosilactobacillus caecicola]
MLPQLGLKGSRDPQQVNDRLQYHPTTYEFYTDTSDFTTEGYQELYDAVQYIQSKGVQNVVIHHPMAYGKFHTDLVAPEQQFPQLYRFIEKSTEQLIRLATDLNVQCLVHGSYAKETPLFIAHYPSLTAAKDTVFKRLDRFAEMGQDHIMFENSISSIFCYGDEQSEEEILAHHYRLAFDTSHCFIYSHGSNRQLQASLTNLKPDVVHYHLVDSMGLTHDSLPLGTGKIDWAAALPLLNQNATSIYEINLKNNDDCREQIQSHHYLMQLVQ